MPAFLTKVFIGLLIPELKLIQDPGLIAIGKVKHASLVTQTKLQH
jgi:hypothetical protein